ncbi:21904_t:CDS:2, partial [Racocetra persica]
EEIWNNPAFETSMPRNEQSEGTYISDVIMPLLRATLSNLPNGHICLSTAERQSLAMLRKAGGISIFREFTACRPTSNQFGVVGVQVAGKKISLNVLINDASGIPRYFHVDHAKIPLTSDVSWRQAISHLPRNVHPSPAVSSPRREESGQKRRRQNKTEISALSKKVSSEDIINKKDESLPEEA